MQRQSRTVGARGWGQWGAGSYCLKKNIEFQLGKVKKNSGGGMVAMFAEQDAGTHCHWTNG